MAHIYTPALRRLRPEAHEFEASLPYIARPSLQRKICKVYESSFLEFSI
jgi:hypothetical protein